VTIDPTAPPRLSSPRRGVNGMIIRAWGGSDLRLRVLEREDVAESFLRLRVDLDGLLARDEVYPTYWLRLWFTSPAGKGHQRAYTVVAPEAETGTGWLEFYLHPGIASDWARGAAPGDEIDATVLNGRNPLADSPSHLLLVGDGASYPAIADTLRRTPDLPATVLLERGYADDEEVLALPERENATVRWCDADGSIIQEALAAATSAPAETTHVVALEGASTRTLSAALRKQLGIPKEKVHALAYWKRTGGTGSGRGRARDDA